MSLIGDVIEAPSPANLLAFVPYACAQLMVPFKVRFSTAIQEEYISKADSKPKKSRAALAHALASRPQVLPSESEDSLDVQASEAPDTEESKFIEVQAVMDTADQLVEIAINRCQEVPRLLMKIISLCVPYIPCLSKIAIRCGLSGYALYETAKILSMSQITEVCLDGSNIPERNYYLLLEYQTHLQHLSLARCRIADEGLAMLISKLAYPLPASKSLRTLSLSSNRISNHGARFIGQALRSNRTLLYLDLSGNRISDSGAIDIFRALMEFHLTTEEMMMKHKRTLYSLRLYKEVYDKCYKQLVSAPISDKSTNENSRPNKRSLVVRARKVSVSVTDSGPEADALAAKAAKMAAEVIGSSPDPFRVEATVCKNGILYSTGNLSLTYLNLSYNNLGYQSVVKLLEVARYQTVVGKYPNLGLVAVQLDGNPLPQCRELDTLSDLLTRAVQVRLVYSTPQPTTRRAVDRGKKSRMIH